jgi:hypothetical protein
LKPNALLFQSYNRNMGTSAIVAGALLCFGAGQAQDADRVVLHDFLDVVRGEIGREMVADLKAKFQKLSPESRAIVIRDIAPTVYSFFGPIGSSVCGTVGEDVYARKKLFAWLVKEDVAVALQQLPKLHNKQELILALGETDADLARKGLAEFAKDVEPEHWAPTAVALGQLRASDAIPTLIEWTRGQDDNARFYSCYALLEMLTPEGANAINRMVRELKSEMLALYTLDACGRALRNASPPERKWLEDIFLTATYNPEPKLRALSCGMIGRIPVPRLLPRLRELTRDPDPTVAGAAAAAIDKIQAKNP